MMGVQDHIDLLEKVFRAHSNDADHVFPEDAILESKTLAEELGVDSTVPGNVRARSTDRI